MAENPEMTFVEDSGRGWRRGVASPEPNKIVEADSILNQLENELIVIACGGGGKPVVRDYENKGGYKGVAALNDKDMGGELRAADCSADVRFLRTAVEHVAINFGKPDQPEREELTADEAEKLADEGQFGKGSMEPISRSSRSSPPTRLRSSLTRDSSSRVPWSPRSAPPSSSLAPARAAPASSAPWTRPPRPWLASPVPASSVSTPYVVRRPAAVSSRPGVR